jgi:predicted ester cyclase
VKTITARRDPTLRATAGSLLREPLFWCAAAAFGAAGLGLAGTTLWAAVFDSYDPGVITILLAESLRSAGSSLAALSLVGAGLLFRGRLRLGGRAAFACGLLLLGLSLGAQAGRSFYTFYWTALEERTIFASAPFPVFEALAFYGSFFLPALVALPFAGVALAKRELRLGAVLLGIFALSPPFGLISFIFFPPGPAVGYGPSPVLVLLGWYGGDVGLLTAPLWALLGRTLYRGARERVLDRAARSRERENLEAALRFYEAGLGRGDLAVVEDLVSGEFRDLRSGARGKFGAERILRDLLTSFPDLEVSIDEQRAEGDLVSTYLTLSGTDRGGVLWYPPTGRSATFSARFVDRFSGGELVEHGGETDTEGLMRQLGLPAAGKHPA